MTVTDKMDLVYVGILATSIHGLPTIVWCNFFDNCWGESIRPLWSSKALSKNIENNAPKGVYILANDPGTESPENPLAHSVVEISTLTGSRHYQSKLIAIVRYSLTITSNTYAHTLVRTSPDHVWLPFEATCLPHGGLLRVSRSTTR